jgi:hypothetical protein
MRTLALLLLGSAAPSALAVLRSQDPKPSAYTDGLYGFSLNAPGFPGAGEGQTALRALFFAAAEKGFADNVNVGVQGTDMTLEQYVELSAGQFKQAGFKVNSQARKKVSGREAVAWDYEGRQGGRELRWLALAVADKSRVFLVTCTASKETFERRRMGFEACLESFKLPE